MKINIKNFRSIIDFSLEIENGIYLLNGESGKGKSTILESIKWCLYGGLQNIYTFGSKKNILVEIISDNIIIKRTKPPDNLEVIYNDIKYKGNEANELISKLFGSINLWLSSSYVEQSCKNCLLSNRYSTNEKENIIKEIIFGKDFNFNDYVEKINYNLEIQEEIVKKNNIKLDLLNEDYENLLKQYNINDKKIIFIESEILDKLNKKIKKIEKQKYLYEDNLSKKNKFEEIKEKLKNYKFSIEYYNKLFEYKNFLDNNNIKDFLEIKKFNFDLTNIDEEIYKYKNIVKNIETNFNLIHDFKILNNYLNENYVLNDQNLDILDRQIKNLISYNNSYNCPNCKITLYLNNKKNILELSNNKLVNIKDLDICNKSIKYIKNNYKKIDDIDAKNKLIELKKYKKYLLYQKLKIDDFDKYNYILENKNYIKEKTNLESLYKIYKEEIIQINKIDESTLEDYKKLYNKYININTLYKKKLEINKNKKILLNETQTLNNLNVLKKIIFDSINEIINNKLKYINNLVNEILENLFDNIYIEITLFKLLKNNTYKSKFNVEVYLNNKKYDNLNLLSGGEQERISIALSITLSCISNSPFLIFDESMSALNENLREKCIEICKKYCKNKIIINVCHSTIHGYYDKIINL